METNINYAAVGAFMIALIAAIVFSIIWLSAGFSFEHYSTYAIYMQESVTGLSIDSSVEFNGVEVGSVKSIELDKKNPRIVQVLIDIKSTTPVTQGTIATLQSKGVTGITYMALKDKSTNLAPLKKIAGQQYPIIRTAPSFFLRLDTALSRLSENMSKVTEAISSLLDKENQQSIKSILVHMDRVTGVLARNGDRLNTILENTAKATIKLNPLLESSAGAMRVLQYQTLPATYQILSNLDSASRSLAEFSVELKQNPSILIRGVERQNLGPGEVK